MKRYVVLQKEVGQTPLMALQKWQKEHPEYAGVPASYAGRLDPMASGALLILLGDECKRQATYTNLDKEYEVDVLIGVGSDTGDVLGLTKSGESRPLPSLEQVHRALGNEVGASMRSYPLFSSKTVRGKPLFMYALQGTAGTIQIPEHLERIYSIRLVSTYTLTREELQRKIANLLALVPRTSEPSKRLGANFRIDKVREGWKAFFRQNTEHEYIVLKLKVVCASGTYMRSLAGRTGESLGSQALALSIARTKLGKYIHLWRTLGLWYLIYKISK